MDEQMREKFEAWATGPDIGLDIRRVYPQAAPYIDYTTAWAWSGWQAAFPAALSQPAAQVDSSHYAGGECGGVQVHPDVEYEVWQNDMVVATASGPGAAVEIVRYAAHYEQDGPVEVFKVTRINLEATP